MAAPSTFMKDLVGDVMQSAGQRLLESNGPINAITGAIDQRIMKSHGLQKALRGEKANTFTEGVEGHSPISTMERLKSTFYDQEGQLQTGRAVGAGITHGAGAIAGLNWMFGD